MLLQTLVQLNILILATPALSGWSLLPSVHAGTFHAAGIVRQYRVAETPALKVAAQAITRQAKLPATTLPRFMPAKSASFTATIPAALRCCTPFPHAARAP